MTINVASAHVISRRDRAHSRDRDWGKRDGEVSLGQRIITQLRSKATLPIPSTTIGYRYRPRTDHSWDAPSSSSSSSQFNRGRFKPHTCIHEPWEPNCERSPLLAGSESQTGPWSGRRGQRAASRPILHQGTFVFRPRANDGKEREKRAEWTDNRTKMLLLLGYNGNFFHFHY